MSIFNIFGSDDEETEDNDDNNGYGIVPVDKLKDERLKEEKEKLREENQLKGLQPPPPKYHTNTQARNVDWSKAFGKELTLDEDGGVTIKSEDEETVEEIKDILQNVNTDDEVEDIIEMLDSLVEVPEADNVTKFGDNATYKDEIDAFRNQYNMTPPPKRSFKNFKEEDDD